jgi:aminopeptidase N
MKQTTIYRLDYQPPAFWVDETHLRFELEADRTKVFAKLLMRRNPEAAKTDLCLDGDALKLIALRLNGDEAKYDLTASGLTVYDVPDAFTLETDVEIHPETNTKLMGLYLSQGVYCTQCEAQAFRRITFYIDRPDVMSVFTTTIVADKKRYPFCLSNGNLVSEENLSDGRHVSTWHDPFKKPAYLFALVAGDLGFIEDHFVTMSGRKVNLRIFADHKVVKRCAYAMEAIKKSMRWDEETYQREYDLECFMIVAVNDFNFGAMENKGLNIFNDKYILSDSETATDTDHQLIDAVVGHEYFHNWSGDRVTLRDWFQITLKEGLTVLREQSFSESVGSRAVERITQVKRMRTAQFPEDDGPLAHPTRPDSYIEMNNFYTMTVYEKGAEVIRMMKTILGDEAYFKGVNLYFERHDGQAVTCDDFVTALEDASGVDLSQFRIWYSQAGTPRVTITSEYNPAAKTLRLDFTQMTPPTPGQVDKKALHIPVRLAMLNEAGEMMALELDTGERAEDEIVLHLLDDQASFTFKHVSEKPVLSLFRDFSAPVKWTYDYSDLEQMHLMSHDADPVARWDMAQRVILDLLLQLISEHDAGKGLRVPDSFMQGMKVLLDDQAVDPALLALMLQLPDDITLANAQKTVSIEGMLAARRCLQDAIAHEFKNRLLTLYRANHEAGAYHFTTQACGKRALKNVCLAYLVKTDDEAMITLCYHQYEHATNMTDRLAALSILVSVGGKEEAAALKDFEKRFSNNALVMDKWFSVQACANRGDVFEVIKALQAHSAFDIKNPNKVRSLVSMFIRLNYSHFHAAHIESYPWLSELILQIDAINPMVAARLADSFSHWRQFDELRAKSMKSQLEKLSKSTNLSKDTDEIVMKSLAV